MKKTEVSIYKNLFDNQGTTCNLYNFLTSAKWKAQCEAVRVEADKSKRSELKKQLPAITPSGRFGKRGKRYLIEHSGYICIDIDSADNPRITDFEAFIKELGLIDEVAFAGLSASGNGAFCLIPIAKVDKHEAHFRQLEEDFLNLGVIIDHACKDVSRARLYSYNADYYYTDTPKLYRSLYIYKHIPKRYPSLAINDVEAMARKVIDTHTIIAPTYEEWYKLACALTEVQGGRELFHAISAIDASKYSPKEADRQFDRVKQSGAIGISTFFYLCKQAGITLK